ncbi:MAG: hypothetical protein Kow0089_20270 [Desulfobulbaceae bacterium]
MGGLSRRAYMIEKMRKEENSPLLLVDAGGMLFPKPAVPPSLYRAQTAQAAGLVEAMARMGYDAVGIAPQDLAAGAAFLLDRPPGATLPWVSANLAEPDGSRLLFPPYVIRQADSLRVAVIGLTGVPQNTQPSLRRDYRLLSWEDGLTSALEQIKGRADMVVLLSSLDEQANRKIAETFDTIHLIIQSGHATGTLRPMLVGNALLTRIGSRGKQLGRLDIDWHPPGKWQQTAAASIKQAKDRLDRVTWLMGRMEKRYTVDQLAANRQYADLVRQREELSARVAELEAKQKELVDPLSTYRSDIINLAVSLPEDPEVRKIVHRTKEAVNRIGKEALAGKQGRSSAAKQAFADMAGWQACLPCHRSQTEFWQQTGHARAWQTLATANQQYNQECVRCHVTLPTYDPDTVTRLNLLAGLPEVFRGVGCETCHGPAAGHSRNPERFAPEKPDEQTCLICHTPDHDTSFNFEEKLPKIRCPAD